MASKQVSMRISESDKKHPKYSLFSAVYGFGLFTPVIDEKEAKDKEPKYYKPQEDKRDMYGVIKLSSKWAWKLNCENTFTKYPVEWNDLRMLTQSDWNIDGVSELYIETAHQGLHKYICVILDSTRVSVLVNTNGSVLVMINNDEIELLGDQEYISVINKLWDAESNDIFSKIITQTFSCKIKQLALFLVFASNNLVLKTCRNQIQFTD